MRPLIHLDVVQPLSVLKSAYEKISSGDCVNIIHDYKFWFWVYSTYAIADTEAKRLHIRNNQIKTLNYVILNDIRRNNHRCVKCEFELVHFPGGFNPKSKLLYTYEFSIFNNRISITQCDSNIKYKKIWLYQSLLDELERLILLAA